MSTASERLTFIVDDNADYHKLFKTAFEEVCPNTQPKFFFSGLALLERLNQPGRPLPDLILLDLFMPGMDGLTTLNHIRQNPRLVKIPTIILSVSDSQSDLLNCYQAGANSYIKKPAVIEDLKHFIDVTCRYWLEVVQIPNHRRIEV